MRRRAWGSGRRKGRRRRGGRRVMWGWTFRGEQGRVSGFGEGTGLEQGWDILRVGVDVLKRRS